MANSLITFKWRKDFGYVIGYWVCEISFRLLMYLKWDLFQIAENDADNEYLYVIFLTLADLLSLFVSIYQKIFKKVPNESRYGNVINKKTWKYYLMLFGLAIIDLLSRFAYYIFHKSFDIDNEEVSQKLAHDVLIFIDIEFRFIFYICLINGDIYKHKICSIISIIIIFFLLIMMDIINLNYTGKYDIINSLYFFLVLLMRSILFPLLDTIVRIVLQNYNTVPSQYMRWRGIFELILLLIISPILIATSNLNFSTDIFSTKLAIASPIYIIFCFVKAILLLNVVYYFTPQSVSFLIISESFAGSFHEIINFFNNEEKKAPSIIISIFEIILVALIGIATLVYEEIIVINRWGLERNVEEAIIERSHDDESLGDYYQNEPING